MRVIQTLIYIYADRGAIPYLKEKIPEFSKMHLDNKIYFLLPQEKDVKDVQETWESYYRGSYDSEIIYYTSDDKIISTYRQDSIFINSSREQNPSIILNNTDLKEIDLVNPYLIDNSMYNISEMEWHDYLEEKKANKNLSCLSNVYENYEKNWKQIQRFLILGMDIFVLLMILEVIINNAILYYEYQMNAVEIIIKKIMRYSFFSRYRKIILITILGDVLGIVIAVCLLRNTQSIAYSFFGAIVLCVVEMFMLIRKTIHLELQQINTMLKGGTL